MFGTFKLGQFDLQGLYVSWPDAPLFKGRIKNGQSVDTWLSAMEEGCKNRKVPQGLWPTVAQNYMRGRATTRFEDLEKVMKNMHGGKYRWTWKKFKIALQSMRWDLNSKTTEAWTIGSIPSGLWWVVGKASDIPPATSQPGSPSKQPFLLRSLNRRDDKPDAPKSAPSTPNSSPSKIKPTKAVTPCKTTTQTTHIPKWLLDASYALDAVVADNPKTMCALSAILIALGGVPSVPAVSAGGAGDFLASNAAKALGAVATDVGTWLGTKSVAAATPQAK